MTTTPEIQKLRQDARMWWRIAQAESKAGFSGSVDAMERAIAAEKQLIALGVPPPRRPKHFVDPHHAARKLIPDAVKAAIEERALGVIESMYRRYEVVGGKEPCLSVGLITDHLRQAVMPEDFRWATKDRQRTWTRSVLESMRRSGKIGSSSGTTSEGRVARCYEPKR